MHACLHAHVSNSISLAPKYYKWEPFLHCRNIWVTSASRGSHVSGCCNISHMHMTACAYMHACEHIQVSTFSPSRTHNMQTYEQKHCTYTTLLQTQVSRNLCAQAHVQKNLHASMHNALFELTVITKIASKLPNDCKKEHSFSNLDNHFQHIIVFAHISHSEGIATCAIH